MKDLRKIQTCNGMVIISIVVKMPWRHTSDWVFLFYFVRLMKVLTRQQQAKQIAVQLLFMTHMCLFIFSNPFVKWDLYFNPRRSHKRRYGLAISQSHFGDKCAHFPLHNVVRPMRLDILYIAPKPHQVCLAAKLKEKSIWDTQRTAALTILALWAVMHTFHFLDCLSLICCKSKRAPDRVWITRQ